jgi:hypothetical protein
MKHPSELQVRGVYSFYIKEAISNFDAIKTSISIYQIFLYGSGTRNTEARRMLYPVIKGQFKSPLSEKLQSFLADHVCYRA